MINPDVMEKAWTVADDLLPECINFRLGEYAGYSLRRAQDIIAQALKEAEERGALRERQKIEAMYER